MSTFLQFLKPLVSRSALLSSLYRDWRDQRSLNKAPEMTALGFRFNGNAAMERGEFEPVETALIRKLLPMSSTVINVGANIGYYCCLALSAGKRVVAFEPMPTNQRYLLRNVSVNGWSSLFECFPMALSKQTGIIEIFGGGTGASLIKGWAGQNYSTLVPVSTMDIVLGERFVQDRPLIIVDIEGAELGMLQGASQLLGAELKPIWFVEISVAEHQPDDIDINPNLVATFELFMRHGYACITADEKPRAVSLDEIGKIAATKLDTLRTHNFIFVDTAICSSVIASL